MFCSTNIIVGRPTDIKLNHGPRVNFIRYLFEISVLELALLMYIGFLVILIPFVTTLDSDESRMWFVNGNYIGYGV